MNRKDKKNFVLKRRLVGLGLIGLCTTAGVSILPISALGLATSVLGICGVAMGVGILAKKPNPKERHKKCWQELTMELNRRSNKNAFDRLLWICPSIVLCALRLSIMHYHHYFMNLYMTC